MDVRIVLIKNNQGHNVTTLNAPDMGPDILTLTDANTNRRLQIRRSAVRYVEIRTGIVVARKPASSVVLTYSDGRGPEGLMLAEAPDLHGPWIKLLPTQPVPGTEEPVKYYNGDLIAEIEDTPISGI